MVVPLSGDANARTIVFRSAGRFGLIREDGSDERYPELGIADQVSWQATGQLADGRVLLLSVEAGAAWRLLVPPFRDGVQTLWAVSLDGAAPVQLTRPEDGHCYGIDPSPEGRRIAFHITGPGSLPYRIQVMDVDGGQRREVAHRQGRLLFGPRWLG